MKSVRKKIANASFMTVMILVTVLFVTTGWAALSFIMPNENGPSVSQSIRQTPASMDQTEKPRSRAPEPSTMVLFGSGILGMVASFVRKTYHAVKRVFDFIASVCGIILLSPLFLITALFIKCTSKGPVLFTQTRVGKDGKLFEI